jgi:hypothetical protein
VAVPQLLEAEDVAVEAQALLEVGHLDSDVVGTGSDEVVEWGKCVAAGNGANRRVTPLPGPVFLHLPPPFVHDLARAVHELVIMRMKGLEPSRGYPHTDLNRARLPIPPHPRGSRSVALVAAVRRRCGQ